MKFLLILLITLAGCKTARHITRNMAIKDHTDSESIRSNIILDTNINPLKMQNDTLRYLQQVIVRNKQEYIGHPLEKILTDIKLQVLSYTQARNIFSDTKNNITGVILKFHSVNEYNNMNNPSENARCLTIEFQSSLPVEPNVALYKKNYKFWTKEEREYYGKQIVKDVVVPGILLK